MINTLLTRRVAEIIDRAHLEKALRAGKKLRVKLGIDPTAKELHLGHTVALRKLRQFQDSGHKAVLIIGDFTAQIGDPSGRSELRPQLSESQVKVNMKNYLKEMSKVVDIKKAEIRYNSEWYEDKGLGFYIELMSKFTVARTLERDDFQKRLKENRDISMLELQYPILQGYDSVAVRADVELGGTDQKFNLLMGRKVQKRFGMPIQDIVLLPLIEGLDGVRKMSKSYGNYIGLSEKALEVYGKIMSIPDDLMVKYFTYLTDASDEEIKQLERDRLSPTLASKTPKEWKSKLAMEIVGLYHGEKRAVEAQRDFEKKFGKAMRPGGVKADFEIKKKPGSYAIVELLVEGKLASSKSEARRKIKEGAVEVDGTKIVDETGRVEIGKSSLIRLGKRFLRIK